MKQQISRLIVYCLVQLKLLKYHRVAHMIGPMILIHRTDLHKNLVNVILYLIVPIQNAFTKSRLKIKLLLITLHGILHGVAGLTPKFPIFKYTSQLATKTLQRKLDQAPISCRDTTMHNQNVILQTLPTFKTQEV